MPKYIIESEAMGDDILLRLSMESPDGAVRELTNWIAETSNAATTAGLQEMGFMLPWAPIADAPKDGTWVILADENDPDPLMVAFQWWRGDELTGGSEGPWEGWMSHAGNPWEGAPPTHFRPWPANPRKAMQLPPAEAGAAMAAIFTELKAFGEATAAAPAPVPEPPEPEDDEDSEDSEATPA